MSPLVPDCKFILYKGCPSGHFLVEPLVGPADKTKRDLCGELIIVGPE